MKKLCLAAALVAAAGLSLRAQVRDRADRAALAARAERGERVKLSL